jgi:hypothetical protein
LTESEILLMEYDPDNVEEWTSGFHIGKVDRK